MAVKVIVKDKEEKEIWSFIADNQHHLQEMAALQGVEIPLSCGCGVCWICLCDVESGGEYLQDDAYGNALMPLPHDEESWSPKQILACVSGIKSEYFSDEEEHIVVLKRMY